MHSHMVIRKARTRFTYILFLDYALLKLRFRGCNALLKTVEIVISSEGDKVAEVEKSIKNRFLHFVRPDSSGLTTVEMTSFQQNKAVTK